MTSEQFIADKQKAIDDIEQQQKEMIAEAAELAKTDIVGALEIIFKVRFMQAEKYIIASKPFPKFHPGGVNSGGPAVVGEGIRSEVIKGPDGSIYLSRNMPVVPFGPGLEDNLK